MKIQENQEEMEQNRTHQLLDYADDVNFFGENINGMKKNTTLYIYISMEGGVEMNTTQTK